ncbi:macrophage mannose receptor 1-like [Hoplias malabaricus]|uniref:macrophage mannose receptor 1-like n=1 Tax=Hoplias malabaricus TaxID=27720 RepID=UPI003462B72A
MGRWHSSSSIVAALRDGHLYSSSELGASAWAWEAEVVSPSTAASARVLDVARRLSSALRQREDLGTVVLHMGTNDTSARCSEVLKEHYHLLLDTAQKKTDTRIVVSGPLPTYRRGCEVYIRLFALHSWLRVWCFQERPALYHRDRLYPSHLGSAVLSGNIEGVLRQAWLIAPTSTNHASRLHNEQREDRDRQLMQSEFCGRGLLLLLTSWTWKMMEIRGFGQRDVLRGQRETGSVRTEKQSEEDEEKQTGEEHQTPEMAQQWVSIIFLYSAVCGASAYTSYRYVFVNESKNWTEAQSYCRQNYTDLATVNNMEEMKNLNTTLKDKTTSSVWIGLNRGNTGRWLWSLADGDLYREGEEYRNWDNGRPNNHEGKEYCVTMRKNSGEWNDDRCNNDNHFVCYDEKNSTHRYIFMNEKKTWHDAQSYCREHYTDLVTVRNQTENQEIWGLSHNNDDVWIGLFNDSWQWSDQSNSSFRYWRSGPDYYGKNEQQQCAVVTGDGQWTNLTCDNKLPFICRENKLVLVNQTLTWTNALRYCKENHTDLVSVHSKEVQSWVMEVAQKASTGHVWLGLRHTSIFGVWFWINGESICYQNWAPGNGTGGEDCDSVERCGAVESRGGQQWVSLPETQQLNFICTNY